MKKLGIVFLMVIFGFGCNQTNSSVDKNDVILKNDTLLIQESIAVKGDFSIYEHDLSMYNEKYFMRITPTIDSTDNTYQSYILLTKRNDTIFNKQINIDSLAQTILKYKIFADSTEHLKIATDYELRKVVYHGVRTNDLYFVADIVSMKGTPDLNILFQISYLGKTEIGKLFVNGFNKKGWGTNVGEIENERNRIITVPQ